MEALGCKGFIDAIKKCRTWGEEEGDPTISTSFSSLSFALLFSSLLLLRWPSIMHQQFFIHELWRETWLWVGDGAPLVLGVQRVGSAPRSRLSSLAPTRGWAGGEEMGSGSGPSSLQGLAHVPCCKIWAARGHHPSSLQVRSRLRCAWYTVHGSAPNVLGGVAVTAVLSCHGDFSSSRCPEEGSAGAAMGAAAPAPCPAMAVAVPGTDFGFCPCKPMGVAANCTRVLLHMNLEPRVAMWG